MTFKELAVGTLKVNMASVSSQGSTDIFTKKNPKTWHGKDR